MEKRVAIVGAGVSGILACKYSLEKGRLHPIVFEAHGCIGGVWARTYDSTRLQNCKDTYQFSDFPWPSHVKEDHPTHTQVMDYFHSYATHFGLFPYLKFNSQVIGLDYVGESYEEIESWDLWGGTGKPFDSKGKWHVKVLDTLKGSIEEYEVEFLILCLGRYLGHPHIPEFPPKQGPEVFNGEVMHAMDYSAMDKHSAAQLTKNKRVIVIGSQKSAVDIAAECATANGTDYPCTMIQRTTHWMLPSFNFGGIEIGFLYFNRFSELLVHKPGDSFLQSFLVTLLSPLRWGFSKFAESYLKWKLPLKKYGMVPKHSFLEEMSSCQIIMLPQNFYDKVKEGSILLRKAKSFSFCKKGVLIDDQVKPLETDLVILATGYKSYQKVKDMLNCATFQKCKMGSPTSIVPLYRQIIHPRIPQVAIIGYSESYASLVTSEIRSQWVAHFLAGNFELPRVREMEKEVRMWENYMKEYAGQSFWKSCIGAIHIRYSDQLCKDMGYNHKRKKGFWTELFEPYGPLDYAGLTHY